MGRIGIVDADVGVTHTDAEMDMLERTVGRRAPIVDQEVQQAPDQDGRRSRPGGGHDLATNAGRGWGLALGVFHQAAQRLAAPEPTQGWTLITVAGVGIVVNAILLAIVYAGWSFYVRSKR